MVGVDQGADHGRAWFSQHAVRFRDQARAASDQYVGLGPTKPMCRVRPISRLCQRTLRRRRPKLDRGRADRSRPKPDVLRPKLGRARPEVGRFRPHSHGLRRQNPPKFGSAWGLVPSTSPRVGRTPAKVGRSYTLCWGCSAVAYEKQRRLLFRGSGPLLPVAPPHEEISEGRRGAELLKTPGTSTSMCGEGPPGVSRGSIGTWSARAAGRLTALPRQ